MSETKDNLLEEINIPATESFALLDTLDAADHRYIKDLKINVSNALRPQTLTGERSYLISFGCIRKPKAQENNRLINRISTFKRGYRCRDQRNPCFGFFIKRKQYLLSLIHI